MFSSYRALSPVELLLIYSEGKVLMFGLQGYCGAGLYFAVITDTY